MVRLLQSEKTLNRWKTIRNRDEIAACLTDPQPKEIVAPDLVHTPHGGFEIANSYILDVPRFLSESRRFFEVVGQEIDVARDIIPGDSSVTVKLSIGTLCVGRVIFCQGPDARTGNPFFDWVHVRPTKGEILTIRCEALQDERRILNGPCWLAPVVGVDSGIFRAGSTYAHDDFAAVPTAAGRHAIEEKLKSFLKAEFEISDHVAALRPIIFRSRALVGLHPNQERLGFFNGLGSKGSLNGPAIAEHYAAHLEEGRPLAPEFDLLQNCR